MIQAKAPRTDTANADGTMASPSRPSVMFTAFPTSTTKKNTMGMYTHVAFSSGCFTNGT